MQIKRTIKGHEFSVQLRAVERAGQLANGAPAYTAHVTIYRDGRDIGSARWDARGFLVSPPVLPDADDSERALHVLAVAIRAHLVATYARAGDRVIREPDYVEMPAEDTSHPVKRLIEARMADPLRAGPVVSVLPADADLARRIIDMLRDAAKDNEHIPVEFGEKSPGRHQCIGRLAAWKEAVYRAEVLEREAAKSATSQRVTFAPGLRGHELRTMAVNARVFAAGIKGPVGSAWCALADALDAAADRDERTARAPASPPAESPAEMTDARRRDLFHVALWDSAKHDFSGAWPSDLSDGGAYLVEQRLAYRANFCGRLHLAPRGRELVASMQAGNAPEAP
jgi:hypothetical protein